MQNVRLFHLAEEDPQTDDRLTLPVCLGAGGSGEPMVVDLATLPHLLVAGRTASGTTACLRLVVVSILKARTPEQVRLILIDPDKTVFPRFRSVPHLMLPVIADLRKADAILGWAVEQMERRQRLFAEINVRRLDQYNQLQEKLFCQPLPNIVIVADELTDLVFASEVSGERIVQLVQNSRAVGIHLVLATRIANVHTIAGHLKSQIPTRIALAVASEPETLDLLDREIDALIEGFGAAGPVFDPELVALTPCEEFPSNNAPNAEADPLYDSAVEFVVREGRCSPSSLRDRFGIGHERAGFLIDRMTKDGVVEVSGSGPLRALLTPGDWCERKETAAEIERRLRAVEAAKQKLEHCLREAEEARRILDRLES